MSSTVTISWPVDVGYLQGDYAKLHANGGSGAVNFDTPVNSAKYDLFPGGAGIFGCGHGPCGHTRCGHAHSTGPLGLGHLPCGKGPCGLGSALLQAKAAVEGCGRWKYGFKVYDRLGNAHSGTPEEALAEVHQAPESPTRLSKTSYNKTTDALVLSAA